MEKITIIVDGSPNKVACIFVKGDGARFSLPFDITQSTNNEAELKAILIGLRQVSDVFVISLRNVEIEVQSDSNNAIQWCAGTFRCKATNLIPLLEAIKEIEKTFSKVSYVWTPNNPAGKMLKH